MKTQRPINNHRRKHPLLRNFALILSVAFLASGSQLSADHRWHGTPKDDTYSAVKKKVSSKQYFLYGRTQVSG